MNPPCLNPDDIFKIKIIINLFKLEKIFLWFIA